MLYTYLGPIHDEANKKYYVGYQETMFGTYHPNYVIEVKGPVLAKIRAELIGRYGRVVYYTPFLYRESCVQL